MTIDINQLAQYMSEERYSKKNLIKIITNSIEQSDTDDIMVEMVDKINSYIHDSYWESKEDYITAICMTDISPVDIAEHILICTLKYPHTVINNIANAVGNIFINSIDDIFTRLQIGTDLLLACENIIYKLVDGKSIMFKSNIRLDDKEQLYASEHIYPPPMKCNPLHIHNNYMSGYLTFNDSVILGNNFNNHNNHISLDVINIQNAIRFTLDERVIQMEHKSKNLLIKQELINWNQFIKEQQMLTEEYKDIEFQFNHKFCSRGRVYPDGYHISYMADEYGKAMINLANKEVLND